MVRWGSLGGLGLGGSLPSVQGLEEAEEASSFTDTAELDAEGLDLDEEVLHIDDLVPDQRLQEDTHQPHQTVLRTHTVTRLTSCFLFQTQQLFHHTDKKIQ